MIFSTKLMAYLLKFGLEVSGKKSNLGEIINEFAQDYNLPAEKIRTDAQVFLNKALDLKLIQLV